MSFKYNPFTGTFDVVQSLSVLDNRYYTQTVADGTFLKLDQTTPQDVENGAPTFKEGIVIRSGYKLIFDGA